MTFVPAFMPLLRNKSDAAAYIVATFYPRRSPARNVQVRRTYGICTELRIRILQKLTYSSMTFPSLLFVSLAAIQSAWSSCTMYIQDTSCHVKIKIKTLTGTTAGSKETTNQPHQMDTFVNQLSAFRFPFRFFRQIAPQHVR